MFYLFSYSIIILSPNFTFNYPQPIRIRPSKRKISPQYHSTQMLDESYNNEDAFNYAESVPYTLVYEAERDMSLYSESIDLTIESESISVIDQ